MQVEGYVYEKNPRSVSQYNQYFRCRYSYYLARIKKVWRRPAAWLAQGTAVHAAAEEWERSERKMSLEDAQRVFSRVYDQEINASCAETPNLSFWFRSGPYAGATDVERRYGIGLEQTEKYLRWYENHPEEVIWYHEPGKPAVELEFSIEIDISPDGEEPDEVTLRGFVDAVVDIDGGLVVRDNKTGKQPGDDFQLGVYALAVDKTYDVEAPGTGDYWMGGSGKPTYPYDLSVWDERSIAGEFLKLETGLRAGDFEPDPEPSKCRFCDVASSCEYALG